MKRYRIKVWVRGSAPVEFFCESTDNPLGIWIAPPIEVTFVDEDKIVRQFNWSHVIMARAQEVAPR